MRIIKMLTALLVTFVCLLGLQTAVFAAEDAIPSITVDVFLRADGSAIVTEVWTVQGVYDGTEYYKALHNLDGITVHSLSAWDETGAEYEILSNWDVDLSLEEKAGRCGILVTDDGYELCWGIGSYGDHEYTVQYTMDGLVRRYGDYAGFYHRFVSALSSAPDSASVTISMESENLSADTARIWAYGFTGEVRISDGSLYAYSTDALSGDDYINLLCRFDAALFPTAGDGGMTFEELQKKAEREDSDLPMYIAMAVIGALMISAFAFLTFFANRHKLSDGAVVRFHEGKKLEASPSIPFGGSLPSAYAAMSLLRRTIPMENLMGAYLVRLQELRCIKIRDESEAEEGAIIISKDVQPSGEIELELYEQMRNFADSTGVLEKSAIVDSAEKFHKVLTKWSEVVNIEGRKELDSNGMARDDVKGKLCFTQTGFEQAVGMLGFKKHLTGLRKPDSDYSAPRELWGDYLVFSVLFGLDEKVLEGMRSLDPEYYDSFCGIYGYNAYGMIYFMNMTNSFSSAASSNIDGSGGSASSAGGGGFTGGGGGGSR